MFRCRWRNAWALIGLLPMVVHGQWLSSGTDAVLSMDFANAKKPFHSSLIVSYQNRGSCRPEVSVVVQTGHELGNPERQEKTSAEKDQLAITIDGTVFTAQTKITKYANGLEFAMLAPAGLVGALERAKLVTTRLGDGLANFDFSGAKGFSDANTSALSACQ
jgi:hypothetical protein